MFFVDGFDGNCQRWWRDGQGGPTTADVGVACIVNDINGVVDSSDGIDKVRMGGRVIMAGGDVVVVVTRGGNTANV
jgi:hypothetical protein